MRGFIEMQIKQKSLCRFKHFYRAIYVKRQQRFNWMRSYDVKQLCDALNNSNMNLNIGDYFGLAQSLRTKHCKILKGAYNEYNSMQIAIWM